MEIFYFSEAWGTGTVISKQGIFLVTLVSVALGNIEEKQTSLWNAVYFQSKIMNCFCLSSGTVCLLRRTHSFSPSQTSDKQNKHKHRLMKTETYFFGYFSPSCASSFFSRYQIFCWGNLFPIHILGRACRFKECSYRIEIDVIISCDGNRWE